MDEKTEHNIEIQIMFNNVFYTVYMSITTFPPYYSYQILPLWPRSAMATLIDEARPPSGDGTSQEPWWFIFDLSPVTDSIVVMQEWKNIPCHRQYCCVGKEPGASVVCVRLISFHGQYRRYVGHDESNEGDGCLKLIQ